MTAETTWALWGAGETETTNVPAPEGEWLEFEVDDDVYELLATLAKKSGKSMFDAAMEILDEEIERREGGLK